MSAYKKQAWASSFDLSHVHVLIVCRGPIRLEAMQAFASLRLSYGILLSEKDSVSYIHNLAPELRIIKEQKRIHRISDYGGANQKEKQLRIAEIIRIAKEHAYTHVFAGYGFMAEDADFVQALEDAGIAFVGPAASVHRCAGVKDKAKNIARQLNVSVTPGIDNVTALSLLEKYGSSKEALDAIAQKHSLTVAYDGNSLEEYAEAILQAAYAVNAALLSLQDIQKQAQKEGEKLFKQYPEQRLRLKYIGGGGGKGQRIVSCAQDIPDAALELLSEAKAIGESDNKNFLIELNIENTRHNEIQLLGNGEWCVALGGRDCSLQMHEQKLVEISLTEELFDAEIEAIQRAGLGPDAKDAIAVLEKDRSRLQEMEDQALRFAKAVKLDSASTFECIVTQDSFFFMEMNTRIQVEHRVTEMVYSLRFCNPDNPEEYFDVESLVLAMLLISVHGKSLPCPKRVTRHISGAEVRLNAQNDALAPCAGGMIEYWSRPAKEKGELRDDQGIGILNPDTKEFIRYYLAGAYDSNIALLLSYGKGRRENLESLVEILRCMTMRGEALATNQSFLYGILHACLSLSPMLKANTGFVLVYLCAVGRLAIELQKIDLDYAWEWNKKKAAQKYAKDFLSALDSKQSLILRVLKALQKDPHACAGWIMRNWRRAFDLQASGLIWRRNPLRVLADLYYYLHLERRKGASPVEQIWEHDFQLLEQGLAFYDTLEKKYLGLDSAKQSIAPNSSASYEKLDQLLQKPSPESFSACQISEYKDLPRSLDAADYEAIGDAHKAWQLGLELLGIFAHLGNLSSLLEIELDENSEAAFPKILSQEDEQKQALRALAPPPPMSADTIVAATGGMFYSRERPDSAPYLQEGAHFEAGDPIYIIEVMKMFNKVYAEFSGTVKEVLVEKDARIVSAGQALFRVEPDEAIHIESPEEKKKKLQNSTHAFMEQHFSY